MSAGDDDTAYQCTVRDVEMLRRRLSDVMRDRDLRDVRHFNEMRELRQDRDNLRERLSIDARREAVAEAALEYLRPHLEAGTFAAPDWAIDLASILTGGKRLSTPSEQLP